MADRMFNSLGDVPRLLKDMGDGTWAEVVAFAADGSVTLTGDVVVDTFGALDDTPVSDPAAASATIPALLRGILKQGAGEYETVAASQTAQVLGATGGTGDVIAGLLIIPASVSPGAVTLLDGATSITIFAGGTNSLTELKPFYVPLGLKSVSGAWKVTTGSNVSVIGMGDFT